MASQVGMELQRPFRQEWAEKWGNRITGWTLQGQKAWLQRMCCVGIVRGNPGVQNLNPYPTLHKPLPLVKGKGFEGSGSGSWRVEGYKGFVNGFVLNALSNYKYKF